MKHDKHPNKKTKKGITAAYHKGIHTVLFIILSLVLLNKDL